MALDELRDPANVALWAYLAVVLVYDQSFRPLFTSPALQNWATVLMSLTLQALPFLVFVVVVSAAISSFVRCEVECRIAREI